MTTEKNKALVRAMIEAANRGALPLDIMDAIASVSHSLDEQILSPKFWT